MPQPTGTLILTPAENPEFDLMRRPVAHACKCGWKENIVPPCGKGVTFWVCKCGIHYRMDFEGVGVQCGETIAKGLG
jgi:hypothetical protein